MKSRVVQITAALLVTLTWSASLRAQDFPFPLPLPSPVPGPLPLPLPLPLPGQTIVYDPSNFAENVLQVIGIVKQLEGLAYELTRLPVDIVNRYRTITRAWPTYSLSGLRFGQPWLSALNAGDSLGSAYRQLVSQLDIPDDVLARMPFNLRQRLQADYGSVELADRVAAMGIDQAGNTRFTSPNLLSVIQAMQDDAAAPADEFLSQTALLTKINTASVLGLRIGEKTNEFLAEALEQLTVDNTRRRETEATLLNATITQWRYGQAYGDSLFRNTAANIDGWRLR